jgi:pilus assembly protein CpaF
MKLGERVKQSVGEATELTPTVAMVGRAQTEAREPGAHTLQDPLTRLKRRAQQSLLNRLGPSLFDSSLTAAKLQADVIRELNALVKSEGVPLTEAERDKVVADITDEVLGYGPIESYLADPQVSEIMVNGLEAIYVERDGKLYATDARFLSDEHLMNVIDRIVSPLGRRIDEGSPMVDARLADGSRVNAIIPPLAIDGPALTIRKFAPYSYELNDLVKMGTLTPEAGEFLSACVRGRTNILVSGGTGSGKTTLLNVLSTMIPDDERIVTIEDAAELRLKQRHVVRLESRPPNIEGKGEVRTRDLVRNALRMRPDRIIVGEVRGVEVLDMMQAMNTGHDGSLSTVHANSPRDALSRVETMAMMSGFDLPMRAIREQLASTVELLVHISRLRDGTRRVTRICGVDGMEGEVVTLSDIFLFDHKGGEEDQSGRSTGELKATGHRPRFEERLSDRGITLPAQMFDGEEHH